MKHWIAAALCTALCTPAHAQFWFPTDPTPDKPATPAPIPEAEVQQWLQSLQAAKTEAESAAKKGDGKKRDAAIQDAAKWASKVADPHGISNANRQKAFEITGDLARQMVVWGTNFGPTKLTMLDVRIKSIIQAAKGQEKARLLLYQGDIQAGQNYDAFPSFADVLEIKEADPAQVKYAIIRGEKTVLAMQRVYLKTLYSRMLELPLTPAERTEWELKNNLHIIDTQYQGAAREAALKSVKTLIDDPKTSSRQRDELAEVYSGTLFGEEKLAFINEMAAKTSKNPAEHSNWIYERGVAHAGRQQWKEAVAAYQEAARIAPANSLARARALLVGTNLSVERLGVRAEALPAIDELSKSTHLKTAERFDITLRGAEITFAARDYKAAKTRATAAQAIAGDDPWMQTRAALHLSLLQAGLKELDAAFATWNAIPVAKLTDWIGKPSLIAVRNQVPHRGTEIFRVALTEKNYGVAQNIITVMTGHNFLTLAEGMLMQADLHIAKGEYDKSLVILKALEGQVKQPKEKETIAAWIANVEKMKTEKAAGN